MGVSGALFNLANADWTTDVLECVKRVVQSFNAKNGSAFAAKLTDTWSRGSAAFTVTVVNMSSAVVFSAVLK